MSYIKNIQVITTTGKEWTSVEFHHIEVINDSRFPICITVYKTHYCKDLFSGEEIRSGSGTTFWKRDYCNQFNYIREAIKLAEDLKEQGLLEHINIEYNLCTEDRAYQRHFEIVYDTQELHKIDMLRELLK